MLDQSEGMWINSQMFRNYSCSNIYDVFNSSKFKLGQKSKILFPEMSLFMLNTFVKNSVLTIFDFERATIILFTNMSLVVSYFQRTCEGLISFFFTNI